MTLTWDRTLLYVINTDDGQYQVSGFSRDLDSADEVVSAMNAIHCNEWYAERRGNDLFYEDINHTQAGFGVKYPTMWEAMEACRVHAEQDNVTNDI